MSKTAWQRRCETHERRASAMCDPLQMHLDDPEAEWDTEAFAL
ncbi:hypothetical protein [Halomarina rubra]|uniref:Uncharacterized protein n=1 Tax=Halomarina rubra TaxID=2071873 RepID=A0ABD6B1H5_9EURY|nr:hypothetical protein [Halomarina rubra]